MSSPGLAWKRVRVTPERHTKHRYAALAFLCLSLVTISFDATVLFLALPDIQSDLNATNSQLQWINTSYLIAFTCLLIPAGAFGDRHGRYRVLTFGLIWFGGFAFLAAIAQTPFQLIMARGAMGIGAAAIMPSTMSILSNIFTDPKERLRAISIWATVIGVGIALGPILGGLLVSIWGWHSVFYLNIPIVLGALIGGALFIPESCDPSSRRADPVGYLLSIVGLTAFLVAIIEAPNVGVASWTVLGFGLITVMAVATFVAWELHHPDPMLDLSLFANPRFTAANFAMTLVFFALMGALFLLTQYMQNVLNYSPISAGFLTLPLTVMLIIGAPVSAIVDRRFGTKVAVSVALTLITVSLIILSTLGTEPQQWRLIVTFLLIGAGLGLAMTPTTNAIQGSLPKEKAGVGSGMNDMTRQVGGAMGVAVLGSIMSVVFGRRLDDAVNNLPAQVRESLPASAFDNMRLSVGAANEVAEQFPALAPAVGSAFVTGQSIALLVAACATFLGLVVTVKYLPARAKT